MLKQTEMFTKPLKRAPCMSKVSTSFSTENGQTSRLSIFYCISDQKNFIPKYLDNAPTDFAKNFRNIEAAIAGKSSPEQLWKNSFQCREILLHLE